MAKKTIHPATSEQRQRYCMNCAKIAVSQYGNGYEGRIDNISLFLSIKGDDVEKELKEKFGEDVLKILEEVRLAVSVMAAYKSDIEKKVMKKNDVTSKRFIKYREAMSKCYKYLFLLDKINYFLIKDTDLEDKTVPSHYWSYVSRDDIQMPEDPDEMVGDDFDEEEDK